VQSAINLTEDFLLDAAEANELLVKFANISEPWCEGLDTIPVDQNIADVLYYDINSLAENVSQGVYDFNEYLIEEISSLQNDLYYTASMLQNVNKYLDYSYWVFFAATIFASIFIVVVFSVSMNMFLSELHLPTLCLPPFCKCLSNSLTHRSCPLTKLMAGVISAWLQEEMVAFVCARSWIGLPFLCVMVLIAWIFCALFLALGIGASDFCHDSPDVNVSDLRIHCQLYILFMGEITNVYLVTMSKHILQSTAGGIGASKLSATAGEQGVFPADFLH
jgi:hypothetical protein